ncbi:MAG: hypothetical protein ACLTYN_05170 [Dysosmobacter welbionis]
MPDRIEMFRRLERQYFRDRLGTLGLQQLDGMILHLLGGGPHAAGGPGRPAGGGQGWPGAWPVWKSAAWWAAVSAQCRREKHVSLTPAGRAHIRASSGFWRSGGMSNTRASP